MREREREREREDREGKSRKKGKQRERKWVDGLMDERKPRRTPERHNSFGGGGDAKA
ncbi:hypothetical protein BKA81DRAFT_351388 [Phyllosticta paracitricarpa]